MSDADRYFDVGVIARFLSKIAFDTDDQCWLWKGGRTSDGYGIFHIVGPFKKTAHRYMLELFKGERLPHGIDGSHTCPNRLCVNPKHLVAETHAENCARSSFARQGHPSNLRKLTWEQACAIRNSQGPLKIFAERYKISVYSVWAIRHGIIYKMP